MLSATASEASRARTLISISGKEARLGKVWVQVKGRGLFTRTVEYLDLIGVDPESAGEVRERIVP